MPDGNWFFREGLKREKSKERSKEMQEYLSCERFVHIDHMTDEEISRRQEALSRYWFALTDDERDYCNYHGL